MRFELDVLDLLDDQLTHLADLLDDADATPYLQGQRRFADAARDRIRRARPDAMADEVLAEAADDVGLDVQGSELAEAPADLREAGALALWTFSLGFVEGCAAGVREAMDELPGGVFGEG